MTEKSSNFTKPLSLAIGRATGVFSRPKLQRRALTAHAATELLSAATLSNTLLDLKPNERENGAREYEENSEEKDIEVSLLLSPRLRATTWHGSGSITPTQNGGSPIRRSSDSTKHEGNDADRTLDQTVKEIRSLKLKAIIAEMLNAHLQNVEYNHRLCCEKGRLISQAIERSVKSLNCCQYKVTALVFIGAVRDKGIELASQCAWDPDTDYFAMATFTNETLFASGIVFATVFE